VIPEPPDMPVSEWNIPDDGAMHLIFCRGYSAVSTMIVTATKQWPSHVAAVRTIDGVWIVAESVESVGTRTWPLWRYIKNYNGSIYTAKVFSVMVPGVVHSRGDAWHWMLTNIGWNYDFRQIGRILLRLKAYELGLITEAHPSSGVDDDAYICSEFVESGLKAGGWLVPANPLGFCTPGDIAAWAAVTIERRIK